MADSQNWFRLLPPTLHPSPGIESLNKLLMHAATAPPPRPPPPATTTTTTTTAAAATTSLGPTSWPPRETQK